MDRHEAHPIELALVAVLVVADALAVLIAAALALVLSLASWSPTPTPTSTPPAPLQHPFAVLAAELVALPHRELMELRTCVRCSVASLWALLVCQLPQSQQHPHPWPWCSAAADPVQSE